MALMKFYPNANATVLLFAFAMLTGCASTRVAQRTPMTTPGLARPNQIWVYNFVAASSDMPVGSSLGEQIGVPSTPPTAEDLETGRRYGALIAQDLVQDIQAMGMPAIQAGPGASPQVDDGIIRRESGWSIGNLLGSPPRQRSIFWKTVVSSKFRDYWKA
jgi:hypothetical protein